MATPNRAGAAASLSASTLVVGNTHHPHNGGGGAVNGNGNRHHSPQLHQTPSQQHAVDLSASAFLPSSSSSPFGGAGATAAAAAPHRRSSRVTTSTTASDSDSDEQPNSGAASNSSARHALASPPAGAGAATAGSAALTSSSVPRRRPARPNGNGNGAVQHRTRPEPRGSGDEDGCDTPLDRRWRKKHGYGYTKSAATAAAAATSATASASTTPLPTTLNNTAPSASATPTPASSSGSDQKDDSGTSGDRPSGSGDANGPTAAASPLPPAIGGGGGTIRKREIDGLLRFFVSTASTSRDAPQMREAQDRVNALAMLDYSLGIVFNEHGQYCTSYPLDLLVFEQEITGPYRPRPTNTSKLNPTTQSLPSANSPPLAVNGSAAVSTATSPSTAGGVAPDASATSIAATPSPSASLTESISAPVSPATNSKKVNDAAALTGYFKQSRFSRVHGRFIIPTILVRDKNISRSSTLSIQAESILNHAHLKVKDLLSSLYDVTGLSAAKRKSPQSQAAGANAGASIGLEAQRAADETLLYTLSTKYIADLMVETKKKKFGLLISSSEKVESARYSKFNINSIPFPGCEFFTRYKENSHVGTNLMFDWKQEFINSQLSITRPNTTGAPAVPTAANCATVTATAAAGTPVTAVDATKVLSPPAGPASPQSPSNGGADAPISYVTTASPLYSPASTAAALAAAPVSATVPPLPDGTMSVPASAVTSPAPASTGSALDMKAPATNGTASTVAASGCTCCACVGCPLAPASPPTDTTRRAEEPFDDDAYTSPSSSDDDREELTPAQAAAAAAVAAAARTVEDAISPTDEKRSIAASAALRSSAIAMRRAPVVEGDSDGELDEDDQPHSLVTDWSKYRTWDVVDLTRNYLRLMLELVADPEYRSGLLVHCISGWDRTPLFVSLLRLTLWADGEIHRSLTAAQILYFTIAYDWMLFSHHLNNRLSKGEDVFFFCFDFLQYITDSKYALPPDRNRIEARAARRRALHHANAAHVPGGHHHPHHNHSAQQPAAAAAQTAVLAVPTGGASDLKSIPVAASSTSVVVPSVSAPVQTVSTPAVAAAGRSLPVSAAPSVGAAASVASDLTTVPIVARTSPQLSSASSVLLPPFQSRAGVVALNDEYFHQTNSASTSAATPAAARKSKPTAVASPSAITAPGTTPIDYELAGGTPPTAIVIDSPGGHTIAGQPRSNQPPRSQPHVSNSARAAKGSSPKGSSTPPPRSSASTSLPSSTAAMAIPIPKPGANSRARSSPPESTNVTGAAGGALERTPPSRSASPIATSLVSTGSFSYVDTVVGASPGTSAAAAIHSFVSTTSPLHPTQLAAPAGGVIVVNQHSPEAPHAPVATLAAAAAANGKVIDAASVSRSLARVGSWQMIHENGPASARGGPVPTSGSTPPDAAAAAAAAAANPVPASNAYADVLAPHSPLHSPKGSRSASPTHAQPPATVSPTGLAVGASPALAVEPKLPESTTPAAATDAPAAAPAAVAAATTAVAAPTAECCCCCGCCDSTASIPVSSTVPAGLSRRQFRAVERRRSEQRRTRRLLAVRSLFISCYQLAVPESKKIAQDRDAAAILEAMNLKLKMSGATTSASAGTASEVKRAAAAAASRSQTLRNGSVSAGVRKSNTPTMPRSVSSPSASKLPPPPRHFPPHVHSQHHNHYIHQHHSNHTSPPAADSAAAFGTSSVVLMNKRRSSELIRPSPVSASPLTSVAGAAVGRSLGFVSASNVTAAGAASPVSAPATSSTSPVPTAVGATIATPAMSGLALSLAARPPRRPSASSGSSARSGSSPALSAMSGAGVAPLALSGSSPPVGGTAPGSVSSARTDEEFKDRVEGMVHRVGSQRPRGKLAAHAHALSQSLPRPALMMPDSLGGGLAEPNSSKAGAAAGADGGDDDDDDEDEDTGHAHPPQVLSALQSSTRLPVSFPPATQSMPRAAPVMPHTSSTGSATAQPVATVTPKTESKGWFSSLF